MVRDKRIELQLTLDEKNILLKAAKIKQEEHLAVFVRKLAIKHSRRIADKEYIKYQFNDKPAPLSERMNWTPVVATKEDLQNE